jgi:hypothetical protein
MDDSCLIMDTLRSTLLCGVISLSQGYGTAIDSILTQFGRIPDCSHFAPEKDGGVGDQKSAEGCAP